LLSNDWGPPPFDEHGMNLRYSLANKNEAYSLLEWVIVYGTIFGYWCNLPIIKTGIFGGYNEFRIYDVTFALLIIHLLSYEGKRTTVFRCLREDFVLKHLYKFALWASFMTIPTLAMAFFWDELVFIGMTIMYLYHLWGFLLFAAYVSACFLSKGPPKLLSWFLLLSTAHLFIYYGQVSGAIGYLWPDVYRASYGPDALSGTLGPNRVTPGMMTFLGMVTSMFVLLKRVRGRFMQPLAWTNVLMALPAIIMIGSRTTFVALIVFITAYVLLSGTKYAAAFIAMIPVLGFAYAHFLGDVYSERIKRNVEKNYGKLTRGEELDEIGIVEGYEHLTSRPRILVRYVHFLTAHPYVIPFGAGFNNRLIRREARASSAHNIYLSLICEVGVIGLWLYMAWLLAYLRFAWRNRRIRAAKPAIAIMSSCVVSMIVTLFAGEHIYPYTPCFCIMGTFLLVMQFLRVCIHRNHIEISLAQGHSIRSITT